MKHVFLERESEFHAWFSNLWNASQLMDIFYMNLNIWKNE